MLQDLIQKYRLFPLWARVLICLALGLVPGTYMYFMDLGDKELALEDAQRQRDDAYRKLQIDEKKVQNIKELEDQKRFTEQQLKKAKQFLPEKYDVEGILYQAASLAKEIGIEFKAFEPQAERLIQGAYPYHEMKINLNLSGTYQQIATYFDRIVNIEPSIYVKSVDLNRDFSLMSTSGSRLSDSKAKDLSTYDKAVEARRNQRLTARTEIAVYRTVDDAVMKQIDEKNKAAAPAAPKPQGT